MTSPLSRIGFIGLDTSHVEAFARLLMDDRHEHHVPGARVTAAYPGGSDDLEISRSRVEGYTRKLRDEFHVEIVDSPEAVAERCDVLFIESVDGRVHRDQFEATVRYGRPTFIDKPFALSAADARAMLSLASEHGVPLMSCSALRYADPFQAALRDDTHGRVVAVSAMGPMAIEPTQPGYFWYGIHAFEMIVSAMGPGCVRVTATVCGDHDLVHAQWPDGRVATYHGFHCAHKSFLTIVHRESAAQMVHASGAARPYYASLLEAILTSLPSGRSDVPAEEMLEVIRLIEAANESRRTGGAIGLPLTAVSS